MHKILRTAAVAAVALLLLQGASCVTTSTNQPANDLERQCQTSEGLYEGYRLSCEGRARRGKACPQADLSEQKTTRDEAEQFCRVTIAPTPQNVAIVKVYVDKQRAIGRRP